MTKPKMSLADVEAILGEPPADAADRALLLSREVQPHFSGQHPAVVGAVLCDLLSIWVAGHVVALPDEQHAALIDELLKIHVAKTIELIPISVDEVRERSGVKP